MKLSLIVAMDKNQGIGKNNDLLWHLPADMQFFKETTLGHVVVMGRKNFESIPEKYRPLPGRENAVLTRNTAYNAPGCIIFHSLEGCLKHYHSTSKTVFIIGGGEIYKEALLLTELDEMYVTEVDAEIDADTFFPEIEQDNWSKKSVLIFEKNEKNPFNFEVFKFTKN